jgi:hypothetical protein
MTNHIVRAASLVALTLSLGILATGCKPGVKIDPKAVSSEATKLPGSADVLAALEKKDYDAAVAGLLKLKMTATAEPASSQYAALAWSVKEKLMDAQASDPKAAEALQALRALTTGR